MRHLLLLLICCTILSCSREELSIVDQIDLGEYKENYMLAKDNALSIDDNNLIIEYAPNEIVLQRNEETSALNIGSFLIKRQNTPNDTLFFLSKITDLVQSGDQIRAVTEVASLDEAFTSINFDSRKSTSAILVTRSFINEAIKIEANSVPAKPTLFIEDVLPDWDFDVTCDSLRLKVFKNNKVPYRTDLDIFGLKLSGHYCLQLKGKIRWGFKSNIIPKPVPVAVFPNILTGIYLDPQLEVYMALKGRVKSPRLEFESTKFNVDMTFGSGGTLNPSSVFPNPPTFTATATAFDYGGSVEVTGFGGVLIYASNIAPDRDLHLLRAGIKVGLSNKTSVGKNKTFVPSLSRYEISTECKVGAKLFADVKLFSLPWGGQKLKFGAEWQSPPFDLPIYEDSVPLSSVSCSKIDEIIFSPSLGSFNLRVNGVGASISDRFNVFINDSIVTDVSGAPLELRYNIPNNFASGIPQFHMNDINIMDVAENACFYSESYEDTEGFNPANCPNTYTDPRNNNQDVYCTTTIGTQVWMQQNLRYEGTPANRLGRWRKNELTTENVVLGRYYTFEEMLNGEDPNLPEVAGNLSFMTNPQRQIQGVCPDGWHIPSENEIDELIANIGGGNEASRNLKIPSSFYWPGSALPNAAKFNAVSAGQYLAPNLVVGESNRWANYQKKATFWTSTTTPSYGSRAPSPVTFEINGTRTNDESFTGNKASIKQTAISVRCIQD